MNFSKFKLISFLLAMLLLGWLLYPRALFMGFIYEGTSELQEAEIYYKKYLEKHPWSKMATLRLANLYDRMVEPEKATNLLHGLHLSRPRDWDIAQAYLDRVENSHSEKAIYEAEREVAKNFVGMHRVHKAKLENLLYNALQHALWQQKSDDVYEILSELVKVSHDPLSVKQFRHAMDLSLKKTNQVMEYLHQELTLKPGNEELREELIEVLLAAQQTPEALLEVQKGLAANPQSKKILLWHVKIQESTGHFTEAIADLEKLLLFPHVNTTELKEWKRRLIDLYLKTGAGDRALKVAEALQAEDRDNPANWLPLDFVLSELKKTDQQIALLEDFLRTFPDDSLTQQKELAEIYLYRLKAADKLAWYRAYLKQTRQDTFALDVAYLLLENKNKEPAIAWLREMSGLFPNHQKILRTLGETYLGEKQWGQAIVLLAKLSPIDEPLHILLAEAYEQNNQPKEAFEEYRKLSQKRPDRSDWILKLAELSILLRNPNEAEIYFTQYATRHQGDAAALQRAGKELLFLGNFHRALKYLEQAHALKEQDIETMFWLAEGYHASGAKETARPYYARVATLLGGKKRSLEETRQWLKSRGQLDFTPELATEYQQAKQRDTTNRDLRTDLMELLAENRQWEATQREIEEFNRNFPHESDQTIPFQVQRAFAKHQWRQAIPLLQELLNKNPQAYTPRRDLAEAYLQMGQWRQAHREYQKLAEIPWEVKDRYDYRIGAHYHLEDLGADDLMEYTLDYRGYLSGRWQAEATITLGRYHSPGKNFSGLAEHGQLALNFFPIPAWQLTGGLSFGNSDRRDTVGALAGLTFRPQGPFQLTTGYEFHTLRTDIPQAVAAGVRQDRGYVTWDYRVKNRVVLSGSYEFRRSEGASGSSALTHQLQPAATVVLWQQPEITLGYQYTFSDSSERNGFFSEVPLLSRVEAHYLVGAISGKIRDRLAWDGGFFVGEDTARSLHFLQGDLWGLHTGLSWHLLPWLDFDGHYFFGKENALGVAGQSHQAQIGFSGHWY